MATREGRAPETPSPVQRAPFSGSDEERVRAMLLRDGMRRLIEMLAAISDQEAERFDGKTGPSQTQRFAFRTNASILRGITGKIY